MSSSSAQASNSTGGLFQCGTCSQTYSRVDHLARHVRSHTQEKPYRCETCEKQFSRIDLLRRHALLHTTAATESQNKRRRTGTNSAVPLRVSKACEACAEHHLKCEDGKPCRRCFRKNIACVVAPRSFGNEPTGPTGLPKEPQLQTESDTDVQTHSDPPRPMNEGSLPPAFPPLGDCNPFNSMLSDTTASQPPPTGSPHPPPSPSCRGDQAHANTARPQPQDRPGDIPAVIDFLPIGYNDLPSGTLTPSGLVGFGVEADLDFSAIDLSFLNAYNTRVPFEFEDAINLLPPPTSNPSHQRPEKTSEDTGLNTSSRLLQPSIWRFVPVPGVHGYSEQADLSLPAQEQIVGTPESFADVSRRATAEKLDSVTRDKILAIVLSQVKSYTFPAVSAFPSVQLLDKLVQFFLAGPIPTASSWIHTSSFQPKKARPELLLAMAAAGAVLTPDRSLHKLGFAIQEVVRTHIPTVFESDNTMVRDLEMSQSFMLQLEIGLWSGSSRKIEISESFQQPLLSMLRRGGRFRRSNYPTLTFGAEDKGHVLERKWRAWVSQESFKRLVYHLLGHNAQSSISLLINPSMSYSELDLPLPEARELWSATSAVEWKMAYQAKFENSRTRIPSLTECIANPDLLQNSKRPFDLHFSCASFLYALWGMVWEYRKLSSLFNARTAKINLWDGRLAMMTRYHELLKVFDYYRISYGNESTLLLELILMHLHMSLEDIQVFCGLEGHEEISRVHASVKEWAGSKTSRLAIWHAGQVVRSARELPPMQLRDFYATSLFHASLTFWAYELASRMFFPDRGSHIGTENGRLDMSHQGQLQQVVCLDDEETTATYRYLTLNRGIPALRDLRPNTPYTQLNDPTAVMALIIDIMEKGDGEPSMPNSPLVENLLNVMRRFRETGLPGHGEAM
ncbi:hypothetical protein K458DRAFT_34491 [Lentithecium fluviatile CBS 122367]|uniref:C6 transcription factor RegA n=1 Tax=Lentithecium fluviatile CBS 122367 TaxID=1168545 RepID=A0A6G1J2A2_9PLEO|nr:hypothetical protein K458DRAFT_34491 [Lentithecium fluviatile CBS 122367]